LILAHLSFFSGHRSVMTALQPDSAWCSCLFECG
jgi:hypothetical protein